MTNDEIKSIQRKINVSPDGFWGPKSIAACQEHLRKLAKSNNCYHKFPAANSLALEAYYGKAGNENNLVTMRFPYLMVYDGKLITSTRVHKKVHDSLLKVLNVIKSSYCENKVIFENAQSYDGVYNNRNKRGGSNKSLHAYGAAIDLDAGDNTFTQAWPMRAHMPFEIMCEFAKEGWCCAGAMWGYDAMHFQATGGW